MFFKVIQLIFSINDKLELNSLAQTACNLIKKLLESLRSTCKLTDQSKTRIGNYNSALWIFF